MNVSTEIDPKLIPLTLDWGNQIGEAFIDGLKVALKKRDERISLLETKLVRLEAALEARGGLKYVGVFREGRIYDPDQFVTHSGAVWHCNARTSEPPGNANASWTLAVKSGERGRDGRDAGK